VTRPTGRSAFPALAAVAVLAACSGGPAEVPPGEGASPAMSSPRALPDASAIAERERTRVGNLRHLWAKGVAELRWKDASGDHFEQGDLDLRWCAGRGLAASVSKFGDRHAWIGSDGVRWWRFSPKATPPALDVGEVAPSPGRAWSQVDACSSHPALLGIAPLVPAEGAAAEVRDGLAWIELSAAALPRREGERFEAAFDVTSLEPRRCRLVDAYGTEQWSVEFVDLASVEQAGQAPGAWSRVPRRIVARRGDGSGSLLLVLDVRVADAAAVDRPELYDLEALRARFAPEQVRAVE